MYISIHATHNIYLYKHSDPAICKTFWCSDHFPPSAVPPPFPSYSSESFRGSGLSYAWSSSHGLVKADTQIKEDSQAVSSTSKEQKHLKTWASSGLHRQEVKVFENSILESASKFYLIFRCLWVQCGSQLKHT